MVDRSLEIKQLKNEFKTLGFHEDIRMVTDVTDGISNQTDIVVEDVYSNHRDEDDSGKNEKIMRTSSISNKELSIIVNGEPGEPIYMSPFFSTFFKTKNNQLLSPCRLHTLYKGMCQEHLY